jgi:hypothetical protein
MNSSLWFLAAISIEEEDWIDNIALTIFVIGTIAVGTFAIITMLQIHKARMEQERRKNLPYKEQLALINRREDRRVASYDARESYVLLSRSSDPSKSRTDLAAFPLFRTHNITE